MFYDLPPDFYQSENARLFVLKAKNADISPAQAERTIKAKAQQAIAAVKARNMSKLATFVHPTQGLRFSPYSYINKESDLVFKATDLKTLMSSRKKYVWGAQDGSGEDLKLTFAEYFNRYIYDKDFAVARQIGYNRILKQGNTVVNVAEAYPDSIFVEYHFPGTKKFDGMDWKSLRLIFQQQNGNWFLVGISHDQWTI